MAKETQSGLGNGFDRAIISSQNTIIGLNPEGGYVTSWRVKSPQSGKFNNVLYSGSELKRTGIPVLFPNYGTVEGLPSHGFGRTSQWTLETNGSNLATMRLKAADLAEQAKTQYPYNFETSIQVQAEDDGSLNYGLNVQNLGTKEMPIQPGLHPYWIVNHADKENITAESTHSFDASKIDWTNTPPDTAYKFDGKALIGFPDRLLTIEDLSPEAVINYLVAWSQKPSKPDFNFVAFEPVTKLDEETNVAKGVVADRTPIWLAPKSEWQMNLRFLNTWVD